MPLATETQPDGWRALARELGPTARLAGPVVLAELGWMAMSVVDLIMVGRLGAEVIAAAGIGNVLYFTVAIVGIGMLFGLDPLVAQAFGAKRLDECHRAGIQGLYLSLILTLPMMVAIELGLRSTGSWGLDPAVLPLVAPFTQALCWSVLPLLAFTAIRRYLQARELVAVSTFALVSANLVNLLGNWIFVYGHWGMRPLGIAGSGWATVLARFYMLGVLVAYAIWDGRKSGLFAVSWRFDGPLMRRLLGLGLPSAVQLGLEVGVFSLAAGLAGRLGATSLAAHEMALHAAATTFMVPLGISSAGAVRVGHAVGRGDPDGAARAGWAAMGLGCGFMALSALAFWLLPRTVLGVFAADRATMAVGVSLLFVAAFFQLFDGLQVVASGALRGLGETRVPMYINLLAHWTIGLPIGYALAFPLGWGVVGIWIGLSSGLTAAGSILLGVWLRKTRRMRPI